MSRISAIILIVLGASLTIAQASDEALTKGEGKNKVLLLPVGTASFGMKPADILSALMADGYSTANSVSAGNLSNGSWSLSKGSSPGDRSKISLSAKNNIVIRMTVTYVSGSGSNYDMNAEAARLIEYFGNDPCENARRMYRCYFPDGNRNGEVILKATLDSRMYSLEFTNKRE